MVLAQASVSFLLFYLFTFKSVFVKPINTVTGILRITALVVAASVSAATALGVVATTRLASAT